MLAALVAGTACGPTGGTRSTPPPTLATQKLSTRAVGIISEALPGRDSSSTYALTYVSEIPEGDCALIPELEELWSTVRPKAEGADAVVVVMAAVHRNTGRSSVVTLMRRSQGGWREATEIAGCDSVLR